MNLPRAASYDSLETPGVVTYDGSWDLRTVVGRGGSLSFVFVDHSIGKILNFAVGGESAATRIDSNIDCLSTTGGGGWFHWLDGRGVVSHTESFKVAQFCLYRHTTATTQGRVVGEKLCCNTSFRFGQLSAFPF